METTEIEFSTRRVFLKTMLLTILFLFVFAVASVVGISLYAKHQADIFSAAAGKSLPDLYQLAKTGWRTAPQQTNGQVLFLILGTDEQDNRDHQTQLTDTMLLTSLHVDSGKVSMFSLPRDLWIDNYQTKINALYEYGKERNPERPEQFPEEVLTQLAGIPIHHTIVLNLKTVSELVDTMGGVDVTVAESFVDTEYPRSDVDVTVVRDPKLLYMSVAFEKGVEHMSGERVLQFVRSRHSESEEGNDVARGQRQQQVILSIIQSLRDPKFLRDPERAGKLLHFYEEHFSAALPTTEVIALAKLLWPHKDAISFQTSSPTIFPDAEHASLFHPKPQAKHQRQWVYEIRDPALFQAEITQALGLTKN